MKIRLLYNSNNFSYRAIFFILEQTMLRFPLVSGLILALSSCAVLPGNSQVSGLPAQVSVPVIIAPQVEKSQESAVYVCTLNAFTETYKAESTNRGKAKLSVKKQCLAEFNEMFCRDSDIKCTAY
ncbi:hypothetical protein [Neisseria dentiae]|nr:hypothetical protein [Neisseria dentiae]